MNPRLAFSFVSAGISVLAAAALVIQAGPAIAEETSDVMEEVIIEAPITVRKVDRTAVGADIELVELKRRVSYADLDLSKHVDVIELEKRVETVSKESCAKLHDIFPLESVTDQQRCVKKSIKSADEQIQAAIVAAN
jgi:UrcA family protein